MSATSTKFEHLTGAEFEDICDKRAQKYHDAGMAHTKRYGVQAVKKRAFDPITRKPKFDTVTKRPVYDWQILQSKPDFEGVVMGGRQFVFDCKVVSGSSFGLSEYRHDAKGPHRRQLSFMYERARFGAKCFFLIHWNARELATKAEPAITFAFPVHPRMQFWEAFEAGEKRSINRMDCVEHGRHVPWTLFGERDRTLQPDFLAAV